MAPQTPNSQVISTFNMVGPSILPKIDMSNINIDPYLLTNILKNVKGHSGNRKMNPELNTTQVRSPKTCFKRSRNSQGMGCEGACAHARVRCAVARVHVRAKRLLKQVCDVRACGHF